MKNTQTLLNSVSFKLSLNNLAVGITTFVIVIAIVAPEFLFLDSVAYFVMLLVLAGIVHGASDYFIHKALAIHPPNFRSNFRFNLFYTSIILLYTIIWYYFPAIALLVFIGTSIYHFGQSNWHQYTLPNQLLKHTIYIIWGAFVTLTPLIFHLEEANSNIEEVLGFEVILSSPLRNYALAFIIGLNTSLIFLLKNRRYLNRKTFLRELLNLFLLLILFATTPLLLGFAIYFAFWHATYATAEQIKILKNKIQSFSLKDYLKSLIIISSLTFIGLGIVYFIITNMLDVYFGWGMFFVFVSLITIPHSYFIDKVYEA